MRRRQFDALLTVAGAALTIVLVAAGALLLWGHNFANDNVRTQLSQQKIYFPDAGSKALQADPEITKYVTPYAGEQVLTGQQAQVFADHYIGVHLRGIADGKTYSEVSNEVQALRASNPDSPDLAKLQGQQDSLFRGESLRGMLLTAYAWWKMGQIALISAWVSFGGAAVMLILTVLGVYHQRKVSPEEQLRLGLPKAEAAAH